MFHVVATEPLGDRFASGASRDAVGRVPDLTGRVARLTRTNTCSHRLRARAHRRLWWLVNMPGVPSGVDTYLHEGLTVSTVRSDIRIEGVKRL